VSRSRLSDSSSSSSAMTDQSPARSLLWSLSLIAMLLAACGAPGVSSPTGSASSDEITVTDLAGRKVRLKAPVLRMILGEGRQLYIIAMLDRDNPFQRIVGWRDDLIKNDLDSYNKYKAKFPQAADVPILGDPSSGELSVEKAIALKPDVLLLNLDAYQGAQDAGVIDNLSKAGIPTVIIDYREAPLENTVPSTLLLGKIMGREAVAKKFVDFYQRQVSTVESRIAAIKTPSPSVFLYRAPGFADCCSTFGKGNLGLIAERAGGDNIAAPLLPGWEGVLNPEQVIASDPDDIIVTGSNWSSSLPAGTFVPLGYSTSAASAEASLNQLMRRSNWTSLSAYQDKRVYAIWHQFYNSPYQFIVLDVFAKWFYPDKFQDIDPVQIFSRFHQEFLPIDFSGTFWIELQ